MFDEKYTYTALLITRSKRNDKYLYKFLGYHSGGGQLKVLQVSSDEVSFVSLHELASFYQGNDKDYKYCLFILDDCEIISQKKFDGRAKEIIDQSTEGFIFEDEAEDVAYLLSEGYESYDEFDDNY